MSKENKTDPKIEMINEIIFLTKVSTEMWQYHPNNPNQIDVEDEYSQIQDKIVKLQQSIELLN